LFLLPSPPLAPLKPADDVVIDGDDVGRQMIIVRPGVAS
jgi:hypothetical protein